MTEEQNDAAIGRVLRERKELVNSLALLEADAHKISQRLTQLAQLLDENPQDVWFYGHSVNTKGPPPRSTPFNLADFDIERILGITSTIRDTRERLGRLNSEASKLGF
jgi:hypothetical protein